MDRKIFGGYFFRVLQNHPSWTFEEVLAEVYSSIDYDYDDQWMDRPKVTPEMT